jgi:hypothetical protein
MCRRAIGDFQHLINVQNILWSILALDQQIVQNKHPLAPSYHTLKTFDEAIFNFFNHIHET